MMRQGDRRRGKEGVTRRASGSKEGRWRTPWSRSSTRLAPALAARAVRLCLRGEILRTGRVERLGLTHYPPVAELHSFALGTTKSASHNS
jgi:hypothetical protein